MSTKFKAGNKYKDEAEKEERKTHQQKRDEAREKIENKANNTNKEAIYVLKKSGCKTMDSLLSEYKAILQKIQMRCKFCNSRGHEYKSCHYKKNIDVVLRISGNDRYSKLLSWWAYEAWLEMGQRGRD